MKCNFNSLKGIHDYIPEEILLWNKVEKVLRKILFTYSYFEIRLPILEKSILFQRSIGENTDIIGKEMYSFYDKNGNSLTLRPEATIGCARAVIQNKLIYHKKQKLWYYGPMFRYERPQKGRYRQFFQLGIETFGFIEPEIELELIMLINKVWEILNISDYLFLEINSIGSIESRKKYQILLKKFFLKNISFLDIHCLNQLHKNPLRILDSKNEKIQQLLLQAPVLMDFIDYKERIHFEKLCNLMNYFQIKYTINHRLVRGLDYYNNTVFEWKTNDLGSKNTICAGGRYDKLLNILGGPDIPAVGLAIGMDRLLLLLQSLSILKKSVIKIDIYIIFNVESIKLFAISLSEYIRTLIPRLKIFLNFKYLNKKNFFKNCKKIPTKIILFLEDTLIKQNFVNIYILKKKKNILVHIDNIIKTIYNIFNISL